jgi:hypothetical protein
MIAIPQFVPLSHGCRPEKSKSPFLSAYTTPNHFSVLLSRRITSVPGQDDGWCHKLRSRSGSARHRYLVPGHSPVYSLYTGGASPQHRSRLIRRKARHYFRFRQCPNLEDRRRRQRNDEMSNKAIPLRIWLSRVLRGSNECSPDVWQNDLRYG